MGEVYTRFLPETAQKTLPLGEAYPDMEYKGVPPPPPPPPYQPDPFCYSSFKL